MNSEIDDNQWARDQESIMNEEVSLSSQTLHVCACVLLSVLFRMQIRELRYRVVQNNWQFKICRGLRCHVFLFYSCYVFLHNSLYITSKILLTFYFMLCFLMPKEKRVTLNFYKNSYSAKAILEMIYNAIKYYKETSWNYPSIPR